MEMAAIFLPTSKGRRAQRPDLSIHVPGIQCMANSMTASCSCGSVELEITGPPIATVVCYCDDCQEGARQLEALPNASAVRDPDGGTALVACRKDRVKCSKGASLLKSHKIRQTSVTNRVVAGCCGSAMVLNFDDAKHWVDVYRSRIRQNAPPVEMRICTRFKPANVEIPRDLRNYSGYPLRFLAKLLAARIAMMLHR